MSDIDGVPIRLSPSQLSQKNTADPWYPFEHALSVAREVAKSPSLNEAIEAFFSIREREQGADLSLEKALFQRRRVAALSEAITEACQLMGPMRKTFPGPERTHVEIGCGLGFDLAASSRSYFGSNVLGIDLSPHYLVMAKKLLREHGVSGVPLVCADIADGWPIPLERYDVGFISLEGVLEHIKDVHAFFSQIRKIRSHPYVVYLTVPYRWTVHPESHFQFRGVGWLPTADMQDAYVKWRLRVSALDHVEQYSVSSLRQTLSRHFHPRAISVQKNSDNPMKARYLRAVVCVESPADLEIA